MGRASSKTGRSLLLLSAAVQYPDAGTTGEIGPKNLPVIESGQCEMTSTAAARGDMPRSVPRRPGRPRPRIPIGWAAESSPAARR